MNATLNPILDSSCPRDQHSQKLATEAFQGLLSDFSLTVLYRSLHPTSREYSFYSDRHKTYSRIEYLLVTTPAISQLHQIDIISNPLSDHAIVFAKITLIDTPIKATMWRFIITLLRNDDFCDYFKKQLNTFLSENAGTVNDPHMLCYAVKGCI